MKMARGIGNMYRQMEERCCPLSAVQTGDTASKADKQLWSLEDNNSEEWGVQAAVNGEQLKIELRSRARESKDDDDDDDSQCPEKVWNVQVEIVLPSDDFVASAIVYRPLGYVEIRLKGQENAECFGFSDDPKEGQIWAFKLSHDAPPQVWNPVVTRICQGLQNQPLSSLEFVNLKRPFKQPEIPDIVQRIEEIAVADRGVLTVDTPQGRVFQIQLRGKEPLLFPGGLSDPEILGEMERIYKSIERPDLLESDDDQSRKRKGYWRRKNKRERKARAKTA